MKICIFIVLALLIASSAGKSLELDLKYWNDLTTGVWLILKAIYVDLTSIHPEMELDAYQSDAEMYQSHGYRFEVHKIITPDNYILTAWRVPGKISESMESIHNKPAVMLQHGLLDNSATWTVNYFNQTLVSLLLDQGYDVWLTNTRGNFNSYEHANPRDYSVFNIHSKYWNFTLDDMARYDLPANIDYILDYTSNKKLTYIGHSQGTVQFFAANCLTNIASKIDKFVGVGPVIYANHATSPAVITAVFLRLHLIFKFFDENNVLLWPRDIGVALNSVTNVFRLTVWRVVQFICGVGEAVNIDLNRVPIIGRREPGGSGLLNMIHWIQLLQTGKFQMMDYGEKENIQVYGQPTAPLYNLTNMEENMKDLPMFLVKGGNDALVSDEDFNRLLDHFKNKTTNRILKYGKTLEYIEVPGYGHLDYLWAKDSYEKVSLPVLDFILRK